MAMQTTTTPPLPAPKRRRLRRLFVGLGIVVALPVLVLLVIAAFFDSEVTQLVVREVNKNLKTELQVQDARLSLFSSFPQASVDLSGVRLKDGFGGYLLAAKEVNFRFDLFSLFGDNIKVRSVMMREGAIRARVNARGQVNYDIAKETPPKSKPASESKLQIALENAEFQNVNLLYENMATRQIAEFRVDNAALAGNFSATKFNLSSQARLTVTRIDLDSSQYLAGEKVDYDAVIAVDLDKDLYDLQRVELNLGGNTFAVDGIAVAKPDFTDLNLKLVTQEGDISVIADLLPNQYHTYFNDFQSTGSYTCTGFVKGRISKTETPAITVEVALRNGKVSSEKLQSPLRNVSFRARLDARPGATGFFEIADFKADFGGQTFTLDLKINNLDDPQVDFHCNGALPLSSAYGLFDNDAITDGDGLIRLNALSVQGRYADMTSMSRIANVNAAGEVQFENAQLTYNKVSVTFQTGTLRLQDNVFSVDSLLVRAGDSDFSLLGNAKNLLPVLFSDSLNTNNAQLEFGATMRSKNLDLDQLLGMFSVQQTASQVGQETVDSLRIEKNVQRQLFTDRLYGSFESTINWFKYGKIIGERFGGKLAFDHNKLAINGDLDAMRGGIHLEGDAFFEQSPRLKLRITARELDLSTCLEQCENFGQDVITAENLRGRLSGRVAVFAFWSEQGDFEMDKLKMYAEVNATNGELQNLKMLEDFSTFVHIEDLRRVKFTNMQNFLEISNRRLYLPVMFIQSNALNLSLSGTHSFDNDIDYKIKVNAGQVLLNRIKKHDSDLDPLPAQKGWFNIFYTIVGNLDKYDMKRGKKAVKAEFERSEARKQMIARALNAEFGAAPPTATPTTDDTEYLDEISGGRQ